MSTINGVSTFSAGIQRVPSQLCRWKLSLSVLPSSWAPSTETSQSVGAP
jgi:hypothetical protein